LELGGNRRLVALIFGPSWLNFLGRKMKTMLTIPFLVLFTGCAHMTSPFVQNDIKIVPPVEREHDQRGLLEETAFNDGGTKWIKITDAGGKTFDIYIDHRIGSKTPGAIYLNAYPEKTNSVRVINQQEFSQKIGMFE